MIHCSEAAELITALVDGELDLDEMDRIKAHLDMCEDCQERRHQESRLKAFLKERMAQVDTPAGLGDRIRACLAEIDDEDAGHAGRADDGNDPAPDSGGGDAGSANPYRLPLTILIVVLASMMGSMLVMKTGGTQKETAGSELATELVALHIAATGAGVLQIRERDPRVLSEWLSERVPGADTVPDLSATGLVPAGARVISMTGTDMAMLLYRDGAAVPLLPPVTVIQSPQPPPQGRFHTEPAQVEGVSVYSDAFQGIALTHFEKGGLTWMVASEQSPEALLDLSRRILSR